MEAVHTSRYDIGGAEWDGNDMRFPTPKRTDFCMCGRKERHIYTKNDGTPLFLDNSQVLKT